MQGLSLVNPVVIFDKIMDILKAQNCASEITVFLLIPFMLAFRTVAPDRQIPWWNFPFAKSAWFDVSHYESLKASRCAAERLLSDA